MAVAFCINNPVAAVVLDSEFFSERGWSLAQTFKSVCPSTPILLFVEDHQYTEIPQAVDAMVETPAGMLQELRRLLAAPQVDHKS
jgi:hypothetical protein